MIRILFTAIILFNVSSCHRIEGPQGEFKDDLATKASPDFKKGWDDGCSVGRSTGANSFYRMFVKNNQVDGWKMASSPDYKIAWSYGFWFCYRDDHIDQKSTPYRSFFGGFQ